MRPPLVVHVIHHLIMGGMENGLVNIVNRMPHSRYRHAIVCIEYFSEFRQRIKRPDVEVYTLNKKPGRNPKHLFQMYKMFKALRPSIVHSRNLSGLDALLPAALARVPCRIHGEHGRDADDVKGQNRKHQLLRKLHKPLVDMFVPLSRDLERYLTDSIGVPEQKIRTICNGVDTSRFRPRTGARQSELAMRVPEGKIIVGTVGRLQPVKNQRDLVDAFAHVCRQEPELAGRAYLVLVGDGSESQKIQSQVDELGLSDKIWLAGSREDIPELMRDMDVFVLPSLTEGISNTILEAMASGLPVVATDVGGNPELVDEGETGTLVPSQNIERMASSIAEYIRNNDKRIQHGAQSRRQSENRFSIDTMVSNYMALYDDMLGIKSHTTSHPGT